MQEIVLNGARTKYNLLGDVEKPETLMLVNILEIQGSVMFMMLLQLLVHMKNIR